MLIDEMQVSERLNYATGLEPPVIKRRVRKLIKKAGIDPLIENRVWYIPDQYLETMELVICPLKQSKEVKFGTSGAWSKVNKSLKAQAQLRELLQSN